MNEEELKLKEQEEITEEIQQVMESNVDKTIYENGQTIRKPRGVSEYEWSWLWHMEETFASSIYHTFLNAFASVIEIEGLPETIDPYVFLVDLIMAGRMSVVKAGKKLYPVHITPTKFGYQGKWLETRIVEPYLPGLTGKKVQDFKNVEIKLNALGSSLTRSLHPWLELLDDIMFNLDTNQKILAGKFFYAKEKTSKKKDNKEEEVSLSQWMTNGQPVKVFERSASSDPNYVPIITVAVQDATQSYLDTFERVWNKLLLTAGIPSNSETKKERMVVGEVTLQNIMESALINTMYNHIKKGFDEFNKVFGYNVEVSLREDLDNIELVGITGEDLTGGQNDSTEK